MNKLSAKEINIRMERIKNSLDITPPTELHMIQQSFLRIIETKGQNRGKVRTYDEAVEYLKNNATKMGRPYVEYTKAQYYQEKDKLVEVISDRLTVKGAEKRYRDGARQLIEAFNEANGTEIDVDNIDFRVLKQILDKATEDVGKRSKDRNDSPKLFQYMMDYFKEYDVKGI